ncbi:MAG: protein translocase subunit SecF [Gammaproteobacteria bacterium]|nr:protein translocase subunit SecF [Gammaproteobacteria bacterium]
MEFFKSNSRVAFMGTRKIWYTMSAILFVTSLAALFTKGLNLGVDFTGGITVEAKFTSEARPEELRAGLERAGFEDVQVQNFGSSRDVAIRLPPPEGQSPDQIRSEIEGVLKTADPAVIVSRLEVVGPQVGAELRNSAAVALISTLILIFIYVFIRFHAWQLSAGAIIAAIHDPVIVLGFFALSGIVFDLSAVAALLARRCRAAAVLVGARGGHPHRHVFFDLHRCGGRPRHGAHCREPVPDAEKTRHRRHALTP